jgi:crotonobetainyl-CoA:carnitine CoA-transferase CaiB-like acyl-CoA transferase
MKQLNQDKAAHLPLHGVKVLDFGHTVMAPTCGLILADLGATVVRVERVEGDPTRSLTGFGSGFFGYLNRNKESVAIDLKSAESRPVMESAIRWADVVIENFGPEVMDRLGYGYAEASRLNPRLVYCAMKGFLPGPYEARTALDEVVQMMGGLAYMTGPVGRPIRAGASIVDMTGGMFGVIGIIAALRAAEHTGHGAFVTSALFETTAFLVGQHMAMAQFGGTEVVPMPERQQAWGVYDLCHCADGQMFIGITSDAQWLRFCTAFGLDELLDDPRLASNAERTAARDWMLPQLNAALARFTMAQVEALCLQAQVPFGPVRTPLDLLEDKHLRANGSLLDVTAGGKQACVPAMPIRINDQMPSVRLQPQDVGAQTAKYLQTWGQSAEQVRALFDSGVVVGAH